MKIPARLGFVLVLLMAFGSSPAADWSDLRATAPIHGDAAAGAAKAAVCVACHGPNGNAVVPAFPRLAAQRADYLYWRLANFKRGAQPESVMTAQTANLSDADLRDLAAYFAAQTATKNTAVAGAPSARGESLFRHGDPARGTPPCQGCHGADANGPADSRFATWPALRGQNADYLAARLKAYRDGNRAVSSNEFVMRGVARSLDDEAIAALASWLASAPP